MGVSTTFPTKKQNMPFGADLSAKLPEVDLLSLSGAGVQKKLRRVPHIFSRVLELPFNSHADVWVREDPDCFKFALITDEITEDVQAHFVEIVPGISKIVIRGRNSIKLPFDELELDVWRFRLPASTKPELASASYTEGQLTVTVPKRRAFGEDSVEEGAVSEYDPDRKCESSRNAEIHGDYGSGRGGISANGSANRPEFDGKMNVGRSNISRLQHLIPVQ